MAVDVDVGHVEMGAVGAPDELLGCPAAALDNLLCIAPEKDLADGFGVGIVQRLSVGKVPR